MADDKRLERIESKIDKITEHTASIDITLAKQHVSLDEHIKRTTQIEKELLPVKKHVERVQGAIALIMGLAALAGLFALLKK